MLYLICTTISHVDHARYEDPYAQEMGTRIWGSCYNSTLFATGIHMHFTWISVGKGYSHDSKANAFMTSRNYHFSSHVISCTYKRKKQKSHDNFRSEKNCMQLFVIINRIRTIFVLSYRVRTYIYHFSNYFDKKKVY